MASETATVGYWQNETSGVLVPAVHAYLEGRNMTPQHIAAMRAYLRQWMAAEWRGWGVMLLRDEINRLTTRDAIRSWLDRALMEGIDPL